MIRNVQMAAVSANTTCFLLLPKTILLTSDHPRRIVKYEYYLSPNFNSQRGFLTFDLSWIRDMNPLCTNPDEPAIKGSRDIISVLSLGGCTAYGLIIESILPETLLLFPGRFGEIAKFLPASLMQSVLSANWTPPALMDEVLPGLLTPIQAAVGIAIFTLFLFGMALWLLKRQDFSG